MNTINSILQDFPRASIAVVGDICLDMYYFLADEMGEISVETGLQTQSVSSFKHEAGGAGNVSINLKTLGAGEVDLYGVIGPDPFGITVRSILLDAGVSCSRIIMQNENWHTHVYHKFYRNSCEEPRCDIGNFNKVSPESVRSLLNDLESRIENYKAVIINEQVLHGYHNRAFQKGLSDLIRRKENACLWISDCRHLNQVYDQCIRKLNLHEAQSLFSAHKGEQTPLPDKRDLALWLSSYWKKPVVITLGEEGAIGIDGEREIREIPGINLIGPKDTVGAGDAFLAGLTLSLASGYPLENALDVANCTASVSVTKLFETGHPRAEEVLAMGAAPDFRYNPDLAADPRKARFLKETPIEILDISPGRTPRVVIFDHDGTISTLRQGWEPIMKKLAVESILGDSLQKVSPEELKEVNETVEKMIEQTTGVQTIIQMHLLRKMVLSGGYVAEKDVLNPQEYKNRYNQELMRMVSYRTELFQKGLLNLSDVTIKGAIPFLKMLREEGVTLYLASGTDQEDVRREAAILGYDTLFKGRIFGSVGDVDSDPKKIVLERISLDLPPGIKAEDCYIFGDGPVEMREAAKRNFVRIGLVSDEKRRFGVNPDKRERLILGGAQVLIPDFSWISRLSDFLNWNLNKTEG